MMTRRHLRSLADALGRVLTRHGISAAEVVTIAAEVVAEMRADGGIITPHYDRDRFTTAVFGAVTAEAHLASLTSRRTEVAG